MGWRMPSRIWSLARLSFTTSHFDLLIEVCCSNRRKCASDDFWPRFRARSPGTHQPDELVASTRIPRTRWRRFSETNHKPNELLLRTSHGGACARFRVTLSGHLVPPCAAHG